MSDNEIVREGSRARVAVKEKLTAADVPALQPALKQLIGDGILEIVFDLERTVSMDSTGIGLLIATNNSLAALKGSIALMHVSPDIMKLLQSMRLATRLNAVSSGAANG